MSKAVLISIRPKWVEKIASGEKTIEVRKTRPKLDTPFRCYIYCTIDGIWYCESCAMHWENNGTCGNESLYIKRPPQSWCYVEAM